MTRLLDRRSIVAIDPSDRGLAFVFFEEGRLIDWGTWRDDGNELALLDRLLDGCAADVLVLEDPSAPGCRRKARVRELLRMLERNARRGGRTVFKVARDSVRSEWKAQGCRTKQQVAAAIAERFPELETVVPPPRKVYRSEDSRVQLFDAASLVLHAFGTSSSADGPAHS
jgi:hypothetical protein